MTTDSRLTNFTTDQNFYQICIWDEIYASLLFAVFIKKLNWDYYKLSLDSLIKKKLKLKSNEISWKHFKKLQQQ